jgi:hypothetical protein
LQVKPLTVLAAVFQQWSLDENDWELELLEPIVRE